jgi:hypothetical protein
MHSQLDNHRTCDSDSTFYKVELYSIEDSSFCFIIDSVLKAESEYNSFFTDSTYFGINIYYSEELKVHIIRIAGTDIKRLYIESDNLTGYFLYKGHYFFIMHNLKALFRETNEFETFYITKNDEEITEDDRWINYFFGYDGKLFYKTIK